MSAGAWQPLSPEQAAELFEGFDRPWWVAGGWAIDLFLGEQTRPHADIDIAVFRDNQPALRAHLRTWDIHIAHKGTLTPWMPDDWLQPPRHQFWARPSREVAWTVEVLLEDRDGDQWVFRRDPAIRMPVRRLARMTADRIPYLCPEVALLYKAKDADLERNATDFEAARLRLDAEERRWLRDALQQAHPGHPWMGRL